MSARVLVVEDDPVMAEIFRTCLADYQVQVAGDGESALEAVAAEPPDLVVLDLRLPGMDGLSVCQELRREHRFPILIVSSRDEDVDKIVGLEVGADDYLAKPFNPRELVARVRALLRRWRAWSSVESRPLLVRGRLKIDVRGHRVELAGKEVRLSPLEFSLLRTLAAHSGQVFSRQALLDRVWGPDFFGDERTVDAHVKQVRKKLRQVDPAMDPIVSVRGVGYRFDL